MSAPSESGASPVPCACTNISLIQLFHELKQKFPGVPDHVVSQTISQYCHDKSACESHLHKEAKASITHAYHASATAGRKLNKSWINPPTQCPNQPIVQQSVTKPSIAKPVKVILPQQALFTSNDAEKSSEHKINTDDNQNIVESVSSNKTEDVSPVTINIDKCIAKYNRESSTEPETTSNVLQTPTAVSLDEGTNYKIHKSNKITSNLNETLEKVKEKKTIKKPNIKAGETSEATDKPKRPSTLEFVKPIPDIAFKQTNENKIKTPSPVVDKPSKETTPSGSHFPLFSVNVNCHMDHGYEPWVNYESPRSITSINLTVCTPTSNMASPICEREDDGGFGQVTVTVSPSTARAPRRKAPMPPQYIPHSLEGQMSATRLHSDSLLQDRSLIERQKERLSRLAAAIAQERSRLQQLTRETKILEAPTPSPAATMKLRDYVHTLRDQCDSLAKRLERIGNEPDVSDFYSNIYTGQRAVEPRPHRPAPPPPEEASWQCHVCTFRNHGLLDKCEECEMPRILVVRGHDGITVRLVPGGRRKFIQSWLI